jgi:hypothetical protein
MSQNNLSLQQHLDAGQLPMFMTAGEVKQHYSVHGEEMENHNVKDDYELWNKKSKESHMRFGKPKSRYEIFKKEGVKHPVEIGYSQEYPEGYIGEGHHRIASMEKIDPKRLMSVEHDYDANPNTHWKQKKKG